MSEPTPEVLVGVNVPDAPIGGPLQQQDFHDTRELEEAQNAGLPTSAGYPLQPKAKLALQEATDAMKKGLAWFEHASRKIEEAHQ